MSDKTYRRLQIDFSQEAYEELCRLQNLIEASSKSKVIRYALSILDWGVDEIRNNNRILVERHKKEGEQKTNTEEIIFEFLKKVKQVDKN